MKKSLIAMLGSLAIIGSTFTPTNSTYSQERAPAPSIEAKQIDPFGTAIYNGTMSAVKHIGTHGGYKATPEPFKTVNDTYKVPIYYNQGKVTIPKLEEVADQLEEGIDEAMPIAIEKYAPKGKRLKGTKSNSEVTIDGTNLTVSYDLQLPNERKEKTVKYESKLGSMYGIASFLTNSAKKDPSKLDLGQLETMARENRVSIVAHPVQDNDPKIDTSLIIITHYDPKRARILWGNFKSGKEGFVRNRPIDNTHPKAYGFFHDLKSDKENINPIPAPSPDDKVPGPPKGSKYIPRRTPVDRAPSPLDPSKEKTAPAPPKNYLPAPKPPAPRPNFRKDKIA